ncbi:hypothetical protein [Sphingomonas phage Kimi]|nr:hypothetical protein [Sphingomonas phage Kimi]
MAWGETPATPELVVGSPAWNAERDRLLLKWQESQKALAAAKETEMEDRKAAAAFVLDATEKKEGVNNHDLGHGYTAKVTRKVNYKLVGGNDKIIETEEAAEKVGNEGKFIIERLIKWTAELSVSEYKKLVADAKDGSVTATKVLEIVTPIVETTDGAPALEIKEPKAKLNNQ